MSKLKNNIDNISSDTQNIVKDYLRLLMVRQTEKLALFFGVLSTVFILSTLLLIVILIASVAFAGFLNEVLDSNYGGYWIVAGAYVLVISILIIAMVRAKKPLFANLFVKFIIFILDVDLKQDESLKGLKLERENLREKLDANRGKIKTDFQLLRYTFLEGLLKEFMGLFARKKKKSKAKSKKNQAQEGENA
jgi:hypothetical protein